MKIDFPPEFFLHVFSTNPAEARVALEHAIVALVDDGVVVGASYLHTETYAHKGLCERELQLSPRPISTVRWGGEDYDRLYRSHEVSVWKLHWNDSILYEVNAQWQTACGTSHGTWIVGSSRDVADAFILDVERKTNDPGDSILVFRNGRWNHSKELYESVQKTSFDDLILEDTLKESIQSDFRQFLSAREQYEELGLAWRRGALFIGPPGNGKTHCVRALVRDMSVPCLYVQSLQHRSYESEQLLQKVFDRARRLRPCVLIFEDLDALVDRSNQSFFLNQLDGFEKNVGLVVLATTNHPDRIDEAIINRPSRFDRKYHFDLPTVTARKRFLANWKSKLTGRVDWPQSSIDDTVKSTDGFSYAYLKELVVSGLMSKLSNDEAPFEQHIAEQAAFLMAQMKTELDQDSA